MWTCWSIYSFKKRWENIPPHVNMCITGATVCVTHRDRRGLGRCRAPSRGTAGRRQAESGPQQQGGQAPMAARGWARSRPPGWTRGAHRAPVVPCWAWACRRHAEVPQSVREGFGAGQKRCFLALEHHGWSLPAAVPRSASGEASGELQGQLQGRGGRGHPHPILFKERDSRGRKSQSSRAGSPSGWGLLQRKVRRSPGLCLDMCGGLPLPPAACVRARAHTHTQTHTHTHTQKEMKETNDLDYILCYLVDYKSVKPSLYIDLQYI